MAYMYTYIHKDLSTCAHMYAREEKFNSQAYDMPMLKARHFEVYCVSVRMPVYVSMLACACLLACLPAWLLCACVRVRV